VITLNTRKREAINAFANSLIDVLGLSFPIPVKDVPGMLGGRLIEKPFIGDNLEAMIRKIDDSFEIVISEDKPRQRKRFSIAHEIGHLFLHMGYLIKPELWESVGDYRDSVYYRFGHSIEEYEANEFAAAFLMPDHEFKRIAKQNLKNGVYNIEEIANYFDVSIEAATIRGKWLGLFSWE
jgi:Zn-dependent peptidase ImmA (M78 family)